MSKAVTSAYSEAAGWMSSLTRVVRNAPPNFFKGKNPKSSYLEFVCTNACSLGSKQEKLELCAQSESYDVIENTETWWEYSHGWEITMDGYKFFWEDTKGRGRGGVALCVKQRFESMEVS